ncbi:MAG: AMP-binding enzyme, partial [bacterium]
ERLGEEVACAVMARKGREIDVIALREHLARHLAPFKVPTVFEVVSEPLPRNASGKILKREIREALLAARD